ncbi:unnamed protein product [Closterium sp. NIES-54]
MILTQWMGVDVYALDFVKINAGIYAMYATELSDEDACYSCVPGDAGVVVTALGASGSAATLGASASAVTGASASAVTCASESAASAEALHTFTLDSDASRCFFRDCTTLTPLAAPVPVSLANPSGVPVVARASTVLPCPAFPFGSLSGLHLPSFSTNLVSNAALQDYLYSERAACDDLYSRQVAASSRVSASGQLAASYSLTRLSSGTTTSVTPRYRVSAACTPSAAPHSYEFPPTTAPLQTLYMDVWGMAPVGGTDQERYFLLVVDDYTHYTTVFPLWRKADVSGVLIPWIHATRCQLRERFGWDFPVLRPHSDRGGKFSSGLLEDICRDEGIRQKFTLPASPQQNGIAERRMGLIMEVARTSMVHAAAPHFLWPFAVRYATHQLNLWPRVSEPKTSPTLRWTEKVGNASVFRVKGALSLVRVAKASKLSSRILRCVFLGFPTDAPPWQFHYPQTRPVFTSQDVTFDESVCFYRLHPHASHPVPLAPLFLVTVPTPVDPLPPQGPAPSGVSQVDPPPLVEPLEISSDSSDLAEGGDPADDDTAATRRSPRLEKPPGFLPWSSSPPPQPAAVDSGAETAGVEPGGAETEGEGSGGAASGGAAIGGAGYGGAASGGAASPSDGGAVGDPAGGPGAG